MTKVTKKHVGKYWKVYWKDPTTFIAESLVKVLASPFSVHVNNGKIIHVDNDLVVLEHDDLGDGSGDYTTIVPQLIVKIEHT
jgi:hypothetical protein